MKLRINLEQLTNKFEEVNFKLDKLSTRVTKIQSDNQLRFSDLESSSPNKSINNQTKLTRFKQATRLWRKPWLSNF